VSRIKPEHFIVDVYPPPVSVGAGRVRVTISNSSRLPDQESVR
jgi:hypothetical protein